MDERAPIVPPAGPRASLFVPTPEMRRYYRNAATAAAREIGIFDVLADGEALSVEDLAARVGAGARRLRALADLLRFHRVLQCSNERFSLGEPAAVVPIADAGWGRLAEVLRNDRPLEDDGIAGRAGDGLRRFHDALYGGGEAAARELSSWLAAAGVSTGTLLDVGAGSGIYSAAWLRDRSDARATLLDRPAVLDLARERLTGFRDRIELLDGDAIRAEHPPSFAVALLANFVHLHSPEECGAAIRRAAAALVPGGVLVVKDLRVEDDRSGPEEALIFAVHMALFSTGGSVYSVEEIAEWLRAAGLAEVRSARLESEPEAVLVVGRKR